MAVSTSTANDLMTVFSSTIDAGFAALSGPVNAVFGTLIALVVALTGIQWAVSPNRELLAGALSKILLIGAFAWLLNDWQALSQTIYAGFLKLGLTAGGGNLSQADFLNPGAVLEQGWLLVKAMGDIKTSDNPLDIPRNLTDALILAIAMIGVMLSFAVLALQIIVALLEFKIVTLGGFVLLPFGVWSKSAFLAERPLGYVVAAGLKVLALAIVVSGAVSVFDQLTPSADPTIYEALSILTAALLLALLALFIPNLAASLVTGGPSLGAGSALTAGLALGGGAAVGAAGLAAAGSGMGGAIAGAYRMAAGAGSGKPPSGPPSPPPRASGAANMPPSGPRPRGPAPSQGGQGFPTASGAARPPRSGGTGGGSDQGSGGASPSGRPQGRSAAFRAYYAANTGRGLLPANENTGVLHPNLRSEES